MFRSGAAVADHLSPVDDDQVQPNGVDLRLATVERFVEPGRIGRGSESLGAREAVAPEAGEYRLDPGAYAATYAERVAVHEGHVGVVLPRSRLMRAGATVWDAGREGRGEGLPTVHDEVRIAEGARFAQFVLAAADHEETYDGTYRGERL